MIRTLVKVRTLLDYEPRYDSKTHRALSTPSVFAAFFALSRRSSAASADKASKHIPHVRPRLIRFAAVILMMTTRPAPAASTERPEDFVRRVYARYRNDGPGVPMDRPSGAAFYTARLLDAFEKDTASPAGGGVTAEWDPVCNCQGFLNLRIKSVSIAEERANMARVQVAFINFRYPQTVVLTLSRTPVGWRIADVGVKDASYQDIGDKNVESIMALLQKANAIRYSRRPRMRRRIPDEMKWR